MARIIAVGTDALRRAFAAKGKSTLASMPSEFSAGLDVQPPKTIGILGGTFDPIHYGHLRTAQELKRALNLSQMRLIPCGYPPHREPPVATCAQRLEMIKRVAPEFPGLIIDDSELSGERTSYTVHTINHLSECYPQSSLFLVMGVDVFQHFTAWHQWQRLLQRCHIVILSRPGYHLDKASVEYQLLKKHQIQSVNEIQDRAGGSILLKELTQYPISASDIRKRITAGRSLQGLMPDNLIKWINTQKLYR